MTAAIINHLFVYGSLRPDDVTGQSWTLPFLQGMTGVKAFLPSARLCKAGGFASLVLEETHPHDPRCGVLGFVLTCEAALWADKLAEADAIEDYPDWYSRSAVTAYPMLPGAEYRCEGYLPRPRA
jgi:hypothetical protein